MARVKVWFNPTHIETYDGYEVLVTPLRPGFRPVVHEFDARTAKEIRMKVDELGANERSVSASVRLDKGVRKPPGFDALMRNLHYNLEVREG
jgi:hypothetical protein